MRISANIYLNQNYFNGKYTTSSHLLPKYIEHLKNKLELHLFNGDMYCEIQFYTSLSVCLSVNIPKFRLNQYAAWTKITRTKFNSFLMEITNLLKHTFLLVNCLVIDYLPAAHGAGYCPLGFTDRKVCIDVHWLLHERDAITEGRKARKYIRITGFHAKLRPAHWRVCSIQRQVAFFLAPCYTVTVPVIQS